MVEYQYNITGFSSQLSVDIIDKIGPKIIEMFPPKRTDNPMGMIECTEYNFKDGERKLDVHLMYMGDEPNELGLNYAEQDHCWFGIDLNKKEVVPYQKNRLDGLKEIKPHLEKILSEISTD